MFYHLHWMKRCWRNRIERSVAAPLWQALNHDEELMDENLNPHVVVLTDALQLANRPGRLVEAILVVKKRFPVHYFDTGNRWPR